MSKLLELDETKPILTVTAHNVAKLRKITGCGMMDCKKALEQTENDVDKAIHVLQPWRIGLERRLVEYMDNLHTFNALNEIHVNFLSLTFEIDCKELCERHGIVYDLRKQANLKQKIE